MSALIGSNSNDDVETSGLILVSSGSTIVSLAMKSPTSRFRTGARDLSTMFLKTVVPQDQQKNNQDKLSKLCHHATEELPQKFISFR